MITPFFGEFLLHPAPVEVSGVTCSHSCAYCFSNIRRAERESQCRSFVNLIQKRFQKDTLVSDLIKNGYAICVSNRTDPFSKSNKADTKTILSHIIQTDCGIFFQTKGGEEFYNYCDFLGASGKQNIVSYFTITSNNNDVTKRIEPGAPLFKERLNQIKYAVRSGHLVIVAFNPIVPQWMSAEQHNEIYSQMRDVGVNHFIYQRLHLNNQDISNFSASKKEIFGDDVLKDSIKRRGSESQKHLQSILLSKINESNVLAFGMPYKTDFFTDVRKKLGNCFPSNYDFINYCHEKGSGVYDFDDYVNSLGVCDNEIFNKQYNGLSAYILRIARQVWKGNKEAQGVKTLMDVLKIYWKDKRISASPQNNFLFRRIENTEECKLYFDYEIHKEQRGCNIAV